MDYWNIGAPFVELANGDLTRDPRKAFIEWESDGGCGSPMLLFHVPRLFTVEFCDGVHVRRGASAAQMKADVERFERATAPSRALAA